MKLTRTAAIVRDNGSLRKLEFAMRPGKYKVTANTVRTGARGQATFTVGNKPAASPKRRWSWRRWGSTSRPSFSRMLPPQQRVKGWIRTPVLSWTKVARSNWAPVSTSADHAGSQRYTNFIGV